MSLFYVVCCKNCGRWTVKEVRTDVTKAVFLCRYCNTSSKMKKTQEYGLSNKHKGPYNNPQHASQVCMMLNGQH